MKLSRKVCLMKILKVRKKQDFTDILKNIVLEKPAFWELRLTAGAKFFTDWGIRSLDAGL